MVTQVIYARVPEDIKDAAESYASERGLSLTAAVVDLLDQGLAAASAGMSAPELRASVDALVAEKAQMAADLRAARSEMATLQALADRARKTVGSCSGCEAAVSGYDLLAVGQCAHCGDALPDLLAVGASVDGKSGQSDRKAFNDHDVLLLLGAVGLAVSAAYVISKNTA
jgi:hypothetical protein